MRLEWLRSDLAGARRASVLLAILLAVSMLATLLLAAHTLRQAGRERGGLRALLTTFISDRSVFERPTKR